MSNKWYFSKNNNVDDILSDEFVDSKFGIDKWTSFAREIIQNSLDAKDDTLGEDVPVKVVFDLNTALTKSDIPGVTEIDKILGMCIEHTNQDQTVKKYSEGRDVLKKDNIYCLKISDYNTTGVASGRDEAWGALVYDTGKSLKIRPGSAGSYGVGKKVPFIISSINTVFYSTFNGSDYLTEGKSILTDFIDEDKVRRSHIGWYGIETQFDDDPRNKVQPIQGDALNEINPYFKRGNQRGTDVVIVAPNIYSNEHFVQLSIINAVLESFFVAIIEKKLVVEITGFTGKKSVVINHKTFEEVLEQYYQDPKGIKRETDTLIIGNLYNYYEAFCVEPEIINIKDDSGKEIGSVELYFLLENSKKKKYYSMIRSHGMKICDHHMNADQPFTAIAYIKGEELNKYLSKLENAAHDNFVTRDAHSDKDSVKVYKKVEKAIENRIIELSAIQATKEHSIDGLEDMLSLQGALQTVSKKNIAPKIKKKKVQKKKKRKKPEPKPEPTPLPPTPPGPESTPKPKKMVTKKKEIESFAVNPFSVYSKGSYHIKFATKTDLYKAGIVVNAIDSDDRTDDTIGTLIKTVKVNGELKRIDGNSINNLSFKKDEINDIEIILTIDSLYKLDFELFEIVKELK